MVKIFCEGISENEHSQAVETSTQAVETSTQKSRPRRMEAKIVNLVADVPEYHGENKRQKMENSSFPRYVQVEKCFSGEDEKAQPFGLVNKEKKVVDPKFGVAFVCGRRRGMEDAVAIHPWLCGGGGGGDEKIYSGFHYYGVYDGHGCSHVAMRCRGRLHELVKEELHDKVMSADAEWRSAMARSFYRMDNDAVSFPGNSIRSRCRPCWCKLQAPYCNAVGSTAVVAVVTPEKIVVANCGDSRAVLCRDGKAVPLSIDHKPDRPDELKRIHAAGGRVIYSDTARVLGVLAMSRAIGDNFLKPYVTCEPEVTITDRTAADEYLILASDGLWDVVSNETACGLASICINGRVSESGTPKRDDDFYSSDRACSDASLILMKLALARGTMDNVSVVVVDLRPKANY